MERRIEQSDSSDNSKKSRSLDLHSLYIEKPKRFGNFRAKNLAVGCGHELKDLRRNRRCSAFVSRVPFPVESWRKRAGKRCY